MDHAAKGIFTRFRDACETGPGAFGARGPAGGGRLTDACRTVLPVPACRKTLLAALVGVLAVVLVFGPAAADQVMLANGDLVSGEILTLGEGKVTIKTSYNEALVLDWTQVRSLSTQNPVEIVLQDGTRLKGIVEAVPTGGIRVVTGSAGEVPIADLGLMTALNPPAVPAVTYTGAAQAAASMTSGNSDKINANLAAKFVARSKMQRLTLRGGWNYGEDKKVVTARDTSGSIKYDFFVTKKLYTYVNSLLEYNRFQDLNLRSTFGGGLGYQFLEDKQKKLAFELGVSYFNEDFRISPDQAFASGRWAVNAEYQVLPGKVYLFHFHEGYFGFEDIADLYLRSEQGVRLTVVKDFYTTFQANLTYDNTPAPGTDKADTTLLFGLGYSFDL